jgi:hypothetical protein
MLDRMEPACSGIDTRNHSLLGNPTDALVVCSRVSFTRNFDYYFLKATFVRHTRDICAPHAAFKPHCGHSCTIWMYTLSVNLYTCKCGYLPLSDIPQNGHVSQNMLEDNETQLWLTTPMYFVGYTVIHTSINYYLEQKRRQSQKMVEESCVKRKNSIIHQWLHIPIISNGCWLMNSSQIKKNALATSSDGVSPCPRHFSFIYLQPSASICTLL